MKVSQLSACALSADPVPLSPTSGPRTPDVPHPGLSRICGLYNSHSRSRATQILEKAARRNASKGPSGNFSQTDQL